MKKPPQKNQRSQIAITATMEDPCMLQLLVETLAETKTDLSYSQKKVESGWKAFDTSSLEARVSGGISFSQKRKINKSFTTAFVFTCTKSKKGKFDLTWSNSLS